MSTEAGAPPPGVELAAGEVQSLRDVVRGAFDNLKAGEIGSLPALIGLAAIVIVFSLTEPQGTFFTAVNFNNVISQMSGTVMLAYGVVFVLLLGEIDLSISFVSGVAGVIVAELQLPGSGHKLPGLLAIVLAIAAGALIGAFQGSVIALIGVSSFAVTLAGFIAWQGVIEKSLSQGVIVIQDNLVNDVTNYRFTDATSWIIAAAISFLYVGGTVANVISHRRAGLPIRNRPILVGKLIAIPGLVFGVVAVSTTDPTRGFPFIGLLIIAMLLLWTYIAKRTTFGRHVYAVGGNAEAARRAGINVARIRILVFMISGAMAGLGGVVLASRLRSVDLNAGGGTLLIDAIAAAVIGGTSLFGGRGEVRDALFGAAIIATIDNGLNIFGYSSGVIFITTGCILLLAVTLTTVLRKRQAAAGR